MKEKQVFRIEEDMIMEYYGDGGDIVIPSGVKDIFFQVFYGSNNITRVSIPGSILNIAPFLFEHCSILKEVTLMDGVKTIGTNSFYECKELEIVRIPSSVEHIFPGAFSNCDSLKLIEFSGSKNQWDNVIKDKCWDENTKGYTVTFIYNNDDLLEAHKHSKNNEEELKKSKLCGCFYCKKAFSPIEINHWLKDDKLTGKCPYCNMDSLIGDKSGYDINEDFLKQMNKKWF